MISIAFSAVDEHPVGWSAFPKIAWKEGWGTVREIVCEKTLKHDLPAKGA